MTNSEAFGCVLCWPADADAAAAASKIKKTRLILADESHFLLAVRECAACEQRFIVCFTELVNWTGGDDAQYVTYLPLTIIESDEVEHLDAASVPTRLKAIGAGRRCLQIDHPTGTSKRIMWNLGFSIGMHD